MVTTAILDAYVVILLTHDSVALLLDLVRVLSAKEGTLFVFYFQGKYHRLNLVEHFRSLLCRLRF